MRTHGRASTYRAGCRCQACRTAHTARVRKEREARRKLPPEQIPHGITGYDNWGCHCLVCTEAKQISNARRRVARGQHVTSFVRELTAASP